jgi:hypothetical protein
MESPSWLSTLNWRARARVSWRERIVEEEARVRAGTSGQRDRSTLVSASDSGARRPIYPLASGERERRAGEAETPARFVGGSLGRSFDGPRGRLACRLGTGSGIVS